MVTPLIMQQSERFKMMPRGAAFCIILLCAACAGTGPDLAARQSIQNGPLPAAQQPAPAINQLPPQTPARQSPNAGKTGKSVAKSSGANSNDAFINSGTAADTYVNSKLPSQIKRSFDRLNAPGGGELYPSIADAPAPRRRLLTPQERQRIEEELRALSPKQ